MIRYQYILLDADNTLYDFDAAEHKALHKVLSDRGYSVDETTVNIYLKINTALWEAFTRGEVTQEFLLVERFRQFVEQMGGGHDPVQFNTDYVTALGSNGDLIPGALEFCRELSRMGCTLAIVTNGATIAQRGRYSNSPLREDIPTIFISQEMGINKPDPLFFDHVCRNMEILDRSQAIVVGDSLSSDILGGNHAGIDTVWYNPHNKPISGEARPTYTTDNFQTIIDIISGKERSCPAK